MALIAHQTQGSYSSLSLRPKPWTKGVKLRSFVVLQLAGGTDEFTSLKHHFHLRDRPIFLPKKKPFKVSSFKGNAQNDEKGGRDSRSKVAKTPVQLSYTQKEKEEMTKESPDVQHHPLSYASEDREDTIAGSPAIQKLFQKWLIILRTQTPSQTMDEIFKERPTQSEASESQHKTSRMDAVKTLKAALVYFLKLDLSINVPLLMFVPFYLTVKVMYGAEVTKELTPLWVLGPLIVALYIKIVQGLCSLYIFCFMQTIRLIKNLPTYCLLVYSYIAEGKLKAYFWVRFWKPVVDFKNLDYKVLFRRKLEELGAWAYEKYLDYVESIWPYYCRTIRFLKKANLI